MIFIFWFFSIHTLCWVKAMIKCYLPAFMTMIMNYMIKEWLILMTLITKQNNHCKYLLSFAFVASIITCSFVGGTNFLSNFLCTNSFELLHHNVVKLAWPLFISISCTFMCNTFISNIVFLCFLFIAMFSTCCNIMELWFLFVAMFSSTFQLAWHLPQLLQHLFCARLSIFLFIVIFVLVFCL